MYSFYYHYYYHYYCISQIHTKHTKKCLSPFIIGSHVRMVLKPKVKIIIVVVVVVDFIVVFLLVHYPLSIETTHLYRSIRSSYPITIFDFIGSVIIAATIMTLLPNARANSMRFNVMHVQTYLFLSMGITQQQARVMNTKRCLPESTTTVTHLFNSIREFQICNKAFIESIHLYINIDRFLMTKDDVFDGDRLRNMQAHIL